MLFRFGGLIVVDAVAFAGLLFNSVRRLLWVIDAVCLVACLCIMFVVLVFLSLVGLLFCGLVLISGVDCCDFAVW